MPRLSVVIPVFNEISTIKKVLEKVVSVNIDKEIIVINDGSSDGTEKILNEFHFDNLKVIHHPRNLGKGAAFLTGLLNSHGDFVIIQDADMEYDPVEYPKLLEAIEHSDADMILGARFLNGTNSLSIRSLPNRFLTGLLNLLFNSKINDYATCFKLAKKSLWDSLKLKSPGFEIEAEIICKAIKMNKRILEVPVSYKPRSYGKGKKIQWVDGFRAIYYMFKYRFTVDK